jgi:hypothetical protein
MRMVLLLALVLGFACGGCGGKGAAKDKPGSFAGEPIVTPSNAMVGKIIRVNLDGRFVVLNFPIGQMPAVDQRLNVYRGGLKVAEVKATGPQRDDNIVADIVVGDCRVGDEVKDR